MAKSKTDAQGREIVGEFILLSGSHTKQGDDGRPVRYRPGSLVPLTEDELEHFGDKFATPDEFKAMVRQSEEARSFERELARKRAKREAESEPEPLDEEAQERAEQIERMRKRRGGERDVGLI